MTRTARIFLLALAFAAPLAPIAAAEPDYAPWTGLLQKYYSPTNGMDYAGLRGNDLATLTKLVDDMAKVDVATLSRDEQLAFWMNLYNIATVKLICDHYPTKSIRELSTDPIVRLNIFKKEIVRQGAQTLSLNDIENVKIREAYKDPRIHFAINCAAKSCPPMRQEAFTGAHVGEQLEEQTRAFINSPGGSKVSKKGGKATLTVSKVMDFFEDDFDSWGGGIAAFTKKYLAADKRAQLDGARVSVAFFDYNWDLNDWKR